MPSSREELSLKGEREATGSLVVLSSHLSSIPQKKQHRTAEKGAYRLLRLVAL